MKNLKNKMMTMAIRVKAAFRSKKAEGYIGEAVKILTACVIGALLLAGLYLLFSGTVLPTLTEKVRDLFDYTA